MDSEASFAALCGLSPVERSSGRRQFASNATRPGRSSTWSDKYSQQPPHRGSRET
ncbi:transposase [Streptomyces griseofuscus]|uniref:transposase n=1 Tax=Streptomyces griseofuscus TaxID=146922 RepID=UPI003691EF04